MGLLVKLCMGISQVMGAELHVAPRFMFPRADSCFVPSSLSSESIKVNFVAMNFTGEWKLCLSASPSHCLLEAAFKVSDFTSAPRR